MTKVDLDKSIQKGEEGLAIATRRKEAYLDIARRTAIQIAMMSGQVSADDVRQIMAVGFSYIPWGPWAGAIFKTPRFRMVAYRRSKDVSRHAGVVGVYELQGEEKC